MMNEQDTIGDRNKPPKLVNAGEYSMWKFRMEHFLRMTDYTCMDSIINGPHRPKVQSADHTGETDKAVENYSEYDKKLMERDYKAMAFITMALPNDIMFLLKEHTNARDLWNALQKKYEGNSEMIENRQDMLRRQYEQFVIQNGESVNDMIIRFTHLIMEMKNVRISLDKAQINKQLLDALPNSWNTLIIMIKRTTNLKSMSLEELIDIIKSNDMSMSRDITKMGVVMPYRMNNGCALLSESPKPSTPYQGHSLSSQTFSNSTFTNIPQTVPTPSPSYHSSTPVNPNYSHNTSTQALVSTSTVKPPPVFANLSDDNAHMLCSILTCYDSLVAGVLSPPSFTLDDMDQVNPDDLEEMDLQWQMAMLTLRSKKFYKKTGRK